jgi:hypothetical protein
MKIVRTVKSIVTSSIKRSLTIALVKIILATGIISLITSYAFGQTFDYYITETSSQNIPTTSQLSDYSLKADWINQKKYATDVKYTINFTDSVIYKSENGSRVLYDRFTVNSVEYLKILNDLTIAPSAHPHGHVFTLADATVNNIEFILSFKNNDGDTVHLVLIEWLDFDTNYNVIPTPCIPVFYEVVEKNNQSMVTSYSKYYQI